MGLGDTLQLLKDIKNGLEVNAAALALAGSRNAAGIRISRIDTPVTVTQAPFGGSIILWDDFENTAPNWTGGGANAGANNNTKFGTNGANIYRGNGALLVETTSTTPLDAHVANVSRFVGLGTGRILKLSLYWKEISSARMASFQFGCTYYNGTVVNGGYAQYDKENNRWRYGNPTDGFTTVSGALATQNLDPSRWHYAAVTVDFVANAFIEFESDGIKWDGRSTALGPNSASVGDSRAQVLIQIENAGANQTQLHFDDVMLSDVTESV